MVFSLASHTYFPRLHLLDIMPDLLWTREKKKIWRGALIKSTVKLWYQINAKAFSQPFVCILLYFHTFLSIRIGWRKHFSNYLQKLPDVNNCPPAPICRCWWWHGSGGQGGIAGAALSSAYVWEWLLMHNKHTSASFLPGRFLKTLSVVLCHCRSKWLV